MCAALSGKEPIAALLVAAGADATVKSTAPFEEHPAGSTAKDIAERGGHEWSDELWEQKGKV